MKSENLIHIKFEYSSALESKRDILASEIDLLKMSQRLKDYKENRMQELGTKLELEKKLKALKLDLGRIQNLLPPIKIPRILKPETKPKELIEGPRLIRTEEPKDELESQLQEIQRRLGSLQK